LIVACIVAVVVAVFAGFGFEKKGVRFGESDAGRANGAVRA